MNQKEFDGATRVNFDFGPLCTTEQPTHLARNVFLAAQRRLRHTWFQRADGCFFLSRSALVPPPQLTLSLSSRFDSTRTNQAIKRKQKNYFQNLILSVTHASYVFHSCVNIVDNFGKNSFDYKMQKFTYVDVNEK